MTGTPHQLLSFADYIIVLLANSFWHCYRTESRSLAFIVLLLLLLLLSLSLCLPSLRI